MESMRIYLAGPISKGSKASNLAQFMAWHEFLMDLGFAVFNPGLSMLVPWAADKSHSQWMAADIPFVLQCQLVIRLPGESVGADEEVQAAFKAGIPVYFAQPGQPYIPKGMKLDTFARFVKDLMGEGYSQILPGAMVEDRTNYARVCLYSSGLSKDKAVAFGTCKRGDDQTTKAILVKPLAEPTKTDQGKLAYKKGDRVLISGSSIANCFNAGPGEVYTGTVRWSSCELVGVEVDGSVGSFTFSSDVVSPLLSVKPGDSHPAKYWPAPDPGPGFRLLHPDEQKQIGDTFRFERDTHWGRLSDIGETKGQFPECWYRRQVEATQIEVGDEVRILVNCSLGGGCGCKGQKMIVDRTGDWKKVTGYAQDVGPFVEGKCFSDQPGRAFRVCDVELVRKAADIPKAPEPAKMPAEAKSVFVKGQPVWVTGPSVSVFQPVPGATYTGEVRRPNHQYQGQECVDVYVNQSHLTFTFPLASVSATEPVKIYKPGDRHNTKGLAPEPGPGYELLQPGEPVQKGDESHRGCGLWIRSSHWAGDRVQSEYLWYRRKIQQPVKAGTAKLYLPDEPAPVKPALPGPVVVGGKTMRPAVPGDEGKECYVCSDISAKPQKSDALVWTVKGFDLDGQVIATSLVGNFLASKGNDATFPLAWVVDEPGQVKSAPVVAKQAAPEATGQTFKTFSSGAVRSSDADGTRFDLVSHIGLDRLAATCAEGAKKYGDHNWLKGMPVSECLNHCLRHVNMYLAGDKTEDHLAHAAWNLFAVMHFEQTKPELVDIPTRKDEE